MFQGSIVALVTPMTEDNAVDWQALESLVEWHINQGTSGIVAVGTSGESATVNFNEHLQIIEHIIKQVAGRIPVIAGTGANSTEEAIFLTKEAKRMNADGVLLVTPYYNKPTQEGLYLHHKAIAEAVEIPQLLYNVPGRTACDLLPETIERLSHVKNIVGVKEATGNIERGEEVRKRCDESFILLSGDDATFLDLMKVGAVGNISVTANVAPKAMSQVCNAALKGEWAEAEKANAPLQGLHHDLFLESNPIPVKWALQQMGKITGGIRLPLTPLSEQYHRQVLQALKQAGVQ